MAGRTKRAALALSQDRRQCSGDWPGRERRRCARSSAPRCCGLRTGIPITDLARQIGVSRPTVYTCIDKALAAGVQTGLKDAYHRPHEPEISDEARAGREYRLHQAR